MYRDVASSWSDGMGVDIATLCILPQPFIAIAMVISGVVPLLFRDMWQALATSINIHSIKHQPPSDALKHMRSNNLTVPEMEKQTKIYQDTKGALDKQLQGAKEQKSDLEKALTSKKEELQKKIVVKESQKIELEKKIIIISEALEEAKKLETTAKKDLDKALKKLEPPTSPRQMSPRPVTSSQNDAGLKLLALQKQKSEQNIQAQSKQPTVLEKQKAKLEEELKEVALQIQQKTTENQIKIDEQKKIQLDLDAIENLKKEKTTEHETIKNEVIQEDAALLVSEKHEETLKKSIVEKEAKQLTEEEKKSLAKLKNDLTALEKEIDKNIKLYNKKVIKRDKLKEELNVFIDNPHEKKLKKELENIGNKITTGAAEIETLKKQKESKEKQLERLKSAVSPEKKDVDPIKEKLKKKEEEDKLQNERNKTDYEKAKKDWEQAGLNVKGKQKELDDLQLQIPALQNEILTLKATKFDGDEERIKKKAEEIASFDKQISDLKVVPVLAEDDKRIDACYRACANARKDVTIFFSAFLQGMPILGQGFAIYNLAKGKVAKG